MIGTLGRFDELRRHEPKRVYVLPPLLTLMEYPNLMSDLFNYTSRNITVRDSCHGPYIIR